MAKPVNSVIGVDLGKHVFKSVLLQRKAEQRFVLTNYASHTVPEEMTTPEDLATHVKLLLKEMGGSEGLRGRCLRSRFAAPHHRATDHPGGVLRSALKLNGLAVLNQECKDFVLNCAPVSAVALAPVMANGDAAEGPAPAASGKTRYLVGGMLRPAVKQISEAMTKMKRTTSVLQLAPVCSFNAFEFAYPDVSNREAFLLLNMGHEQSTVLIGNKSELVLVRSIDYGGKIFAEDLTASGAVDAQAARVLIQEGDAGMNEICRTSLFRLATEVRNSIGFFEGQSEESISRIFVSGGMAKTEMILQILSDELGLPCEIWDPLESCEVALPPAKRQALASEFVSLNVACGAAISFLKAA